jgi:hypothetical protein
MVSSYFILGQSGAWLSLFNAIKAKGADDI